MPYFIEHLGLESLVETEENVRGFVCHIMQEGKAIVGYYGQPYFNHHLGSAQIIVRAIRNDEEKAFNFCGIDTHSSGHCVWKAQISGMDISKKDTDILERRCVIFRADEHGGMAVLNVVNADVLPSYDEGTVIQFQVIAFPFFIEYYKNEEEYTAAQPNGKDGHKWLLGDGTLMPVGLMTNRNPKSDKFETNEELDDLTLIRGTVKGLCWGTVELFDEKADTYVRCIIDTEYGELEIVHTLEDVDESQHDNIRVGATVYGSFILSGDPAIYDYEDGCVFDEDNDLAILRSTFAGNDPERLRYALSENATYIAGYNKETVHGRDAIINRIKYVQSKNPNYFAYNATLSAVDEDGEPLPYAVGRRCLVLAENEETNYTTIAFIELDEEGRISQIETSTNCRYHFRVERNKSQN